MSKITSSSTLRVEDFPGQKDWIGNLFQSLNSFISNVVSVVNGSIEFGPNIPCVTKTLLVSSFPAKFQYGLSTRPTEVKVCQALKNQLPVAVVIAWSFDTTQISITSMFELTAAGAVPASGTYQLTLRALP